MCIWLWLHQNQSRVSLAKMKFRCWQFASDKNEIFEGTATLQSALKFTTEWHFILFHWSMVISRATRHCVAATLKISYIGWESMVSVYTAHHKSLSNVQHKVNRVPYVHRAPRDVNFKATGNDAPLPSCHGSGITLWRAHDIDQFPCSVFRFPHSSIAISLLLRIDDAESI